MENADSLLRSDAIKMTTSSENATVVLKWYTLDLTHPTLIGLVSILVLGVNSLVIGTIVATPSLHTRSNMYVLSLAVTDFIVGMLGLLIMSQYLAMDWFDRSKEACLSVMSLMYSTCTCSIFNIVLVALDRYVYILKPFLYERVVNERRMAVAIAVTWVVALLDGAAIVIYNDFHTATHCTSKEVVPALLRCYIAVPLFLICCSVTIFVYTKIGQLTVQTLKDIARTRAHIISVAAAVPPQSPMVADSSAQSPKTSNSRFTPHLRETSQHNEATSCPSVDAKESETVSNQHFVNVNTDLHGEREGVSNGKRAAKTTGRSVIPKKVASWDACSVPKDSLGHNTFPNQKTRSFGFPSHQSLPSRACPGPQPSQLASNPPLPPPVNHQRRTFPPGSLKAVRLFIVVTGMLVVCWAPLFIAEIINLFMPVSDYVYFLSGVLGLLNSGFNAIAFILMNKELRQVLMRGITHRCSRVSLCCPKRDRRVGPTLNSHFSRIQGRPVDTSPNIVTVATV